MTPSTEQFVSLISVIALGLLLGRIRYREFSLGSSGVLFAGLAAGHFGFQVPGIAGVAGIVLFVYCLGLGAGPGFLSVLQRWGSSLILMAAVMLVAAVLAAWITAKAFGLTPGLAAGLFAGALTSTPGLAAAADLLPDNKELGVGFGIAYPFGVIGVLLFVQLLPQLMPSSNPETESDDEEEGAGRIVRLLVKVTNPSMAGRRLRDVSTLAHANCQVSRILIENRMKPIPAEFTLQTGQQLLVIGNEHSIRDVVEVFGEEDSETDYVLDVERQRRDAVVTSDQVARHTLKELHLLSKFGVTITRVRRQNVQFVPGPDTRIRFGDVLTAIGEAEGLDRFVRHAGHKERKLDETDLIAVCMGVILGTLLGHLRLGFGQNGITLGLAGGPLLAGLLIGHFGRLGPLSATMPRAARLLMSEIGLVLFLAHAGASAGGALVFVLKTHGVSLAAAACILVAVPLATGLAVARLFLNLNHLQAAGGICGAMTSTPGLGAVTSSTDSNIPTRSYAAIYPVALVIITVLSSLLVSLL